MPNQIVMFRGNDYVYANSANIATDPKRIEAIKIQAPIVIESVAIYPGVDLADGVTLRYPSGNASNQKYLSVCSANVNMQDIVFQKITGSAVVDSTCASGGANVATSTLNSTIRSSIFFKSTRTGARRAVTILPTGTVYAWEVSDAWWPLDEGMGNVAGDVSPNNNVGSVFPTVSPTWATTANSKFAGAY